MLASYLTVLRRRTWTLVVLVLIFASLIYSYLGSRPTEYRSIAVLEVGSTNLSDTLLGQTPGYVDPVRRVATESDIVTSQPVTELARAELEEDGRLDEDGGLPGTVRAVPRATSNYIDVVATASTPADARAIAEVFSLSYLEHRQERVRADSNVLEVRLTAGLEEAQREVARLEASAGSDPAELTAATESVQRTQELIQNLRFLRSVNGSDVSLAFPAGLPTEPLNDRSLAEAIGISLIGATFLSLGIIFVLELLQDTVRSPEEAERLTETPVLGVVPVPSRGESPMRSVTAASAGRSGPAAGLRLGVLSRSGGAMPGSVLVAGLPGDASDVSLVGSTLATACADSGQAVLLVDDAPPAGVSGADLDARPAAEATSEHNQLPVVRAAGTTVSWCPLTGTDGRRGLLDVPFPKEALAQLTSSFDLVVIGAGTTGVRPTDLTHLAEATIVVCAIGRTASRSLIELLGAFEHRGRDVLGLVATSAQEGASLGRRRLPRRGRREPAPDGSTARDSRTVPDRPTGLAHAHGHGHADCVPQALGAERTEDVGSDGAVAAGELVPGGATWNPSPGDVRSSGGRRGTGAGEKA